MKCPPMLMRLRFKGEESEFKLWLPLVLLLPLALAVFIVLLPLILIAILVLRPSSWGKRVLPVIKAACEIFWSVRGLSVNIHSSNQCLYISVA